VNRFQFVADHRTRYGVKRLCQIVGVARSSFYHWQSSAPARAARAADDAALAERIRRVHADFDGTYGVPRITAQLREGGERVNHKRVARVMRGIGLQGLRLRRRHRTTVPDPAAAKAPDLIGRDSPLQRRTAATSVTSLTCPSVSVVSFIWQRFSTSTADGWSATPSPITCAPIWSSTRWPPPDVLGAAWPEQYYTPTTAPSTPLGPSPPPATPPGYANP
jgi:transposase InsO family protein